MSATRLARLSRALEARGLEPPPPVGQARLARAHETLGFALPGWLTTVYERFDGIPLAAEVGHLQMPMALLPLERALHARELVVYSGPRSVKLVFLAELDSDPLAQFVDGPLAGLVIRLAHDGDGATLLFRNESEFLDAVIERLESSATSLGELKPTMTSGAPSDADVAIGLAAASANATDGLDAPSASLVRQIAADLIGKDADVALGSLLDDDDIYVREKAELTLRGREDPPAKILLKAYEARYDVFTERCRQVLERGGWQVAAKAPAKDAPITWRSLRVEAPGKPISLALGMFYVQRKQPDFEAWLAKRVTALKEAKR